MEHPAEPAATFFGRDRRFLRGKASRQRESNHGKSKRAAHEQLISLESFRGCGNCQTLYQSAMKPAALIALIFLGAASGRAEPLNLVLPTENDALLRGDGPAFYQYVERDYHGEKSTPWEGGQYGFVRDPVETAAGIVYMRFHEGIDIRPMQRDERGEPLDEVRAIAQGKVVYTSLVPGYSNYGKYIV